MPTSRRRTRPRPRINFSRALLRWYDRHGRHDLPWQHPRSAYRVWLSEIMLQQTQVTTVIPYFQRFVKRFPNLSRLAGADLDEVLHLWSGLGYYARARNLQRAAQLIRNQYKGKFPRDFTAVCALPGIGRSTAGAILAQAFGARHAILDGNVKRVLTRYHAVAGWPGDKAVEQQLWELAEHHTPQQRLADYTQAIMDLGATVCTRRQPRCNACPLQVRCMAYREGDPQYYPQSRPRKTLPVRQARFLLLSNPRGHILLQRRPPLGIWGGLWSLPECPPDQDPVAWCQQTLNITPSGFLALPTLRHSFSHYHLEITPLAARVRQAHHRVMDNHWVWYSADSPQTLGLPKPVETLITEWIANQAEHTR